MPLPGTALNFLNTPSAHDMLVHIAQSFPSILKLIGAVAYAIGVILVIQGIIKWWHEGKGNPQPGNTHGAASGAWAVGMGALLLNLPSAVGMLTDTMLGGNVGAITGPLDYQMNTNVDASVNDMLKVIYQFIAIVGFIAIIRGVIILKETTDGDHNASVAKGIIFLVGGTIAINLQTFVDVLKSTAGVT